MDAVDAFVDALRDTPIHFEQRRHEPARHARHLASLWEASLAEAGRATLFYADSEAVLALVPADRKVGAPRLRALLGVEDLRVLRGDRGVGRVGWRNLPGEPGALPAIPGIYGARCLVDERVLARSRVIISLGGDRSLALAPRDFVTVTGASIERFTGTTRLLPQGGMVDDAAAD